MEPKVKKKTFYIRMKPIHKEFIDWMASTKYATTTSDFLDQLISGVYKRELTAFKKHREKRNKETIKTGGAVKQANWEKLKAERAAAKPKVEKTAKKAAKVTKKAVAKVAKKVTKTTKKKVKVLVRKKVDRKTVNIPSGTRI